MRIDKRTAFDVLGLSIAGSAMVWIVTLPDPQFDETPSRYQDSLLEIELRKADWCSHTNGRQVCETPTWTNIFAKYKVPGEVQTATLVAYGSPTECADRNLNYPIGSTVMLKIPSGTEKSATRRCQALPTDPTDQ